jgi:hypothetical protein
MQAQPEHLGEEVARLQRCISNLEGILVPPALWSDGQPRQIVRALLDALLDLLSLDIVYVRLKQQDDAEPVEMARVMRSPESSTHAKLLGQEFRPWLDNDPEKWPRLVRNPLEDGDIAIATLRLGLHRVNSESWSQPRGVQISHVRRRASF